MREDVTKMAFGDYWLRLQQKNTGLSADDFKMTITVGNFRKALEQAYQEGLKQQEKVQSLFDQVFGKFGKS